MSAEASIISEAVKYVPVTLTGLALAKTLSCGIYKVPQGHVGVVSHGGKVYNSDGEPIQIHRRPGIKITYPFIGDIAMVSVKDRFSNLEPLTVDCDNGEGEQRDVVAKVRWRISGLRDNPIKSIYNVSDDAALEQGVINTCGAGLNMTVSNQTGNIIDHTKEIEHELISSCSEELLDEYGVVLNRLYLGSVALTWPEKLSQSIRNNNVIPLTQLRDNFRDSRSIWNSGG